MKIESHIIIGVTTWTAFALRANEYGDQLPAVRYGAIAFGCLYALIGSMLPDMDHPRSAASQSRAFGLASRGVRLIVGHRGALHSIPPIALILIGFSAADSLFIGLPLAWGYGMHLLADLLTVQGIPLFWPLSSGRIALPSRLSIRTGSGFETIYLCAFVAISAIVAFGLTR